MEFGQIHLFIQYTLIRINSTNSTTLRNHLTKLNRYIHTRSYIKMTPTYTIRPNGRKLCMDENYVQNSLNDFYRNSDSSRRVRGK